MPAEDRRHITGVRTMRALANPLRYRILGHLMEHGPQTASQCAEVVGATPSNCSYHLRELARYGLVERVDAGAGRRGASRAAAGGDGRERPWRATASGFDFGRAEDLRPAASTAAQAVAHAGIAES